MDGTYGKMVWDRPLSLFRQMLSRRCDNALLSPRQTPLGMKKEEAFAGPCDDLRTGKKILNQN